MTKVQISSMKESRRLVKENMTIDADINADSAVLYALNQFSINETGLSAYIDDGDRDNVFTVELDDPSYKDSFKNKLEQLKHNNLIASYETNADNSFIVTAIVESKKSKKESEDDVVITIHGEPGHYTYNVKSNNNEWGTGGTWYGNKYFNTKEDAIAKAKENYPNAKILNESKRSKKEASDHPAIKAVKDRVKKEFPDFEVKGPVPDNYDHKEGREQYLIAVPDDSTEGRYVERMLQEIESQYSDFEYEGVDWDNRYWFNIPA